METRICSKCKIKQSIEEFHKHRSGKRYVCKSCRKKVYSSQEYKDHKNKLRNKNYKNNPVKYLLKLAAHRARKNNIPFDLTIDDLEIPDKCPILGVDLKSNDQYAKYDSYSIDRIIPSLGYIKGNVQIISFRVNTVKGDATIKELRSVACYLEFSQHNDYSI